MNACREMPKFGKSLAQTSSAESDDDSWGCIVTPLLIVIAYFVLMAISRVTSGSGSKLDQVICYGTLIFFIIIMLLGMRDMSRESKARAAERRVWAQGCKTSTLLIVNRYQTESGWDDYSNRAFSGSNYLELEMNTDQKAAAPNQTVVSVEVDQSIYNRSKDRTAVCIYYVPNSPLTFLLEEEL